ncbi:TonB-dependent receptor plug domain-containing protein [Holophaga foetida]|uniref:TonB-dependent receptor plug domain-containing protein n=1 Tax=Holophaga foetida TaxID=35839 RepID=UPI0002475340|nr:TonB-dependent receptor plug domain-containing protein [Holophaga foetida]
MISSLNLLQCRHKGILGCLALLVTSLGAANQTGELSPKGVQDLLELMNTPVDVASKRPQSLRESPGAVTVLTREEILGSGARDLLEALALVPGFQAMASNFGHVGSSMRGLASDDGKFLILVDGQEMNEITTGTFALGNHVPVDQISRIEIIRGPGSAIYGGFAGLAVVKVSTRSGEELQGISASAHLGQTGSQITTRDYSAAYGGTRGDLTYSLAYSWGTALRGQDFTTATNLLTQTPVVVNMGENSRLYQGFLNVGLRWRDASLRFIRDLYEHDTLVTSSPMETHGTYLELGYAWHPTEGLGITPRLAYKEQSAWDMPDPSNPNTGRRFRRTLGGFQANYTPSQKWNILAGMDYWEDTGITNPVLRPWSFSQAPRVTYQNQAIFLQMDWTTSTWTATLGGRYDHNSQAGGCFVPRLAVTRAWNGQHFKLLAARAFRTPTFWNLDTNPAIKPERIRTLELEYGFQISEQAYLTLNAFDTRIDGFIFHVPTPTPPFATHRNGGALGTRGVEAELRFQGAWGDCRLGLESHRATVRDIPEFQVPDESNYLVGMANLKLTFLATLRLTPTWDLCPSITSLGPRYTMEGGQGIQPRDSATQVNLVLNGNWPKLGMKASFGARNMTDARPGYATPQSSNVNETLPNLGREYFARLGYNF